VKAEYDPTKMKSRRNTYARKLKKQIALCFDGDGQAPKCSVNLELRKSRMVNKHSHHSLPEFLISRWEKDASSGLPRRAS
jgi:hypothetical protein